ncbi:helix-turn-helix domain-containing protein [Robbsia sp. Bb-Pol-6]|uniref:Helix-turn-helix domain-containing protein n=1 Tax=Robbsia betulipollinis TaxID=2981849 RepID=A0ABT3ZMX4_9BURK|nr:helix-turn-helix domain-containing protein [Robbsia betulipollinis]MCY0387906.1 helix-turn-helix domain-containing protein [Robbsia betulipollinis]
MSKYTDEQKVAVAVDYCSGSAGMRAVALRHGVDFTSLRQWVAGYREHGAAGVQTKPRQRYSAEFKLAVVLRKRAERLSDRQAAALFNVRRFNIIRDWERAYDAGGVGALEPYITERRKKAMKKPLVLPERAQESDVARSKEDLIAELNQLRMENAYLKKLDGTFNGSLQHLPINIE